MNTVAAATDLLKQLIAIPSRSREERATADLLEAFLTAQGLEVERQDHNVWVRTPKWQRNRPVLLLNSHHDTVRPNAGWIRDPFQPVQEGEILYGLGSNDAGASLVCLIHTFLHFAARPAAPVNLVFAATAEEEISGPKGIASILEAMGPIDAALVGEPTQMHLAVAEKGLMVVDGEATGEAGHAAREEGLNALYLALEDIQRIRNYRFERISDLLGPTKATVTAIEAGQQHNVIPDQCRFVIDVRTNEYYSNQEALTCLQALCRAKLKARSFRLNSSGIAMDHPLVQAGRALGRNIFGSPTLSDQALMPFPSLKIGPGDSARSHTADEYIRIPELEQGLTLYRRLIEGLAGLPWP